MYKYENIFQNVSMLLTQNHACIIDLCVMYKCWVSKFSPVPESTDPTNIPFFPWLKLKVSNGVNWKICLNIFRPQPNKKEQTYFDLKK